MTDHDLSLEISAIRDMSVRIARGTFDGCDADMLRKLRQVTYELVDAVEVTACMTETR